MSEEDRLKWEARYRTGSHLESQPEPLLAEALAHAPPGGRALDIACGRGRHAIALARRGYEVDAFDISPAALASAERRAGGLKIRWRQADLDDARLERGAYAVVVCVNFTDEALVPRLIDALAPGGVLVFKARPRPFCRHGPERGEVRRWFASLQTLIHREHGDRIEYVGAR
ncbi:MAG: class I SAM-dependent methyltransferase [Planctomycetota bacterium]